MERHLTSRPDLAVVILTFNEEIHIARCLDNVQSVAKEIFIIDSFSTDRTLEIASTYPNVTILQNKWENNYAKQFNWGLEHAPITASWVMRLDADEYLTPELVEAMRCRLPQLPADVTGIQLPLRRVFLGRTIRRGMPKVLLLRIFRRGVGRSEVRLMDEHIQLSEGHSEVWQEEFADDNLNDLSWWTQKHVGYAIREAVDLLDIEYNLTGVGASDEDKQIGAQAQSKRMKKHKYATLPLFWRSTAYFLYRYVARLGFLEGKEGFLWHFLQGWWYRTLVDAKVLEIKRATGGDPDRIRHHLQSHYHINL